MIKVKVYLVDPPLFSKRRHSYTKNFCKIEDARDHIALCEMGDINFNNLMGICSRRRRFFKLDIKSKKPESIRFRYIPPRFATQ